LGATDTFSNRAVRIAGLSNYPRPFETGVLLNFFDHLLQGREILIRGHSLIRFPLVPENRANGMGFCSTEHISHLFESWLARLPIKDARTAHCHVDKADWHFEALG